MEEVIKLIQDEIDRFDGYIVDRQEKLSNCLKVAQDNKDQISDYKAQKESYQKALDKINA